VEIELDPPQPPTITRLVGELLAGGGAQVDPWWQAGVDEALGTAADTEPAPDGAAPRPRPPR
jgi:hypothetical protein